MKSKNLELKQLLHPMNQIALEKYMNFLGIDALSSEILGSICTNLLKVHLSGTCKNTGYYQNYFQWYLIFLKVRMRIKRFDFEVIIIKWNASDFKCSSSMPVQCLRRPAWIMSGVSTVHSKRQTELMNSFECSTAETKQRKSWVIGVQMLLCERDKKDYAYKYKHEYKHGFFSFNF